MDGTIICQGSFTQPATAVNQLIQIPSGVDWMWTYNKTQIDTPADGIGIKYYWQRGFPAAYAIEYKYEAGHTAVMIDSITTGGFTLYDPSGQSAGSQPLVSAPVAATAITNATRPVVSTGTTTGLVAGVSVVRLSVIGADSAIISDLGGIDFVVGAVSAGVSFTLLQAGNALATAPGLTSGSLHYRIVNVDPLFYPRRRHITKITAANPAQVSTSVAHGMVAGQAVRFSIPAVSGMIQMDGLVGTIVTVVDDFNFTVNIDSSAFTAFTYPTVAQQPSSFPIVVPVGEDTGSALASVNAQTPSVGGLQIFNTNVGILSDSTVNTGFLGMLLPTGANSPGGVAADNVFWVAGKSTFGGL